MDAYRLTNVGVVFLRELTDSEFEQLGTRIATHATAIAWAVGDWLVAGVGRGPHGHAYELGHRLTGRSYESLSQYARVSAAFDHEDRDPRVPWSLYRELLRLPKAERVPTIPLIRERNWNRTGLCEYINTQLQEQNLAGNGPHESGQLTRRPPGRPAGWHGVLAPKQKVRCPHCGQLFDIRRKGVTEAPIEAAVAADSTPLLRSKFIRREATK